MTVDQQRNAHVVGDVSIQWGAETLRVTVDFDTSQLTVAEVERIMEEISDAVRQNACSGDVAGDKVGGLPPQSMDLETIKSDCRVASESEKAANPGCEYVHESGAMYKGDGIRIR